MLRQIEKLQKMVNHLLGLCADSGADVVHDDYSLSPEEKKYERLGVMVLKAQDGVLEPRYILRMEKWLTCDPKALQYYVDFQSLTAMLYIHFDPDRFSQNLNENLFVTR
jgi:hypothetical protein